MPIYDMYPYSNLHELNLDFIIKLCEEFKDGVEGFEQEITDLGTRLEGEIDALEDRIEPFEQMFTLQTVGGETQIRANYRMYAGHGLTASSLKVNGALELEQPFIINLTGDVEGTASTNNLLNPLNIETTVVNGGGGGGETLPKVIFDGTIQGTIPFDNSTYIAVFTEPLELIPGNSYTVIWDGSVYDTVFQFTNITNGYAMGVGAFAQISFNNAIVMNNTLHSVKILQKYAVEKELIYSSVNHGFEDQGGYYEANEAGLIPNLGMGDYTVYWDGVKYDLKAHVPAIDSQDFNASRVVIGSEEILSGGTPEYPFCFDGASILTSATGLTHSFALYGPKLKNDKVVLYAATNPVLNSYNDVYADPYLMASFNNVTDLRQFIQNKTPVINPSNGTYGFINQIQYPVEFVNDANEPDITIVCEERANGNFYMYGIGHIDG